MPSQRYESRAPDRHRFPGVSGAAIEDLHFPPAELFTRLLPFADPLEFASKIRAAVDTRTDPDFCIVARVEARPIPEVGGTFVYIRGVRDDYLIQLQVEGVGSSWYSPATSQYLPITLLPKNVAP